MLPSWYTHGDKLSIESKLGLSQKSSQLKKQKKMNMTDVNARYLIIQLKAVDKIRLYKSETYYFTQSFSVIASVKKLLEDSPKR